MASLALARSLANKKIFCVFIRHEAAPWTPLTASTITIRAFGSTRKPKKAVSWTQSEWYLGVTRARQTHTYLNRLFVTSPELTTQIGQLPINKKGRETPVADAKTLIHIIWLLPGGKAQQFRRSSSEKVCRLLGGDLSLVSEIEERHASLQASDEGRSTQEFLLGTPSVRGSVLSLKISTVCLLVSGSCLRATGLILPRDTSTSSSKSTIYS